MKIDRTSLLVNVDGGMTLGALEDALRKDGLTLRVDPLPRELAVSDWLAQGAHGAPDPWSDPADHLVAGMDATLKDGRTLAIRPAPRRAVGPDLIAMFVGMGGRFGRIDGAWLRVHSLGSGDVARVHPLVADRDPPMTDAETRLLGAIEIALRE